MVHLDWTAAINSIRETLPQTQFQNWFKPLELLRYSETAVVLGVPSPFHRDWLQQNYTQQIKKAIQDQAGTELQLEFEILRENASSASSAPPLQTPSSPVELSSPSKPSLRIVPNAPEAKPAIHDPKLPQFAQPYLESEFNHVAYQCSGMFVRQEAILMNPLVILGGVGMGKTHLLADTGKRVIQQNQGCKVRYITSENFTADMIQSIKTNDTFTFKRVYRQETDCLIFDDIHLLKNRLKTQEELLHIFNEMDAKGGRIIFSTNVAPHRLEGFIEPLKSRLMSGILAEIAPPSFQNKIDLLEKVAGGHQIVCDRHTLSTLVDQGQKNIRELVGSLLRIHLQARLEKRSIDTALVVKSTGMQAHTRENVTLNEILALVEHNFGVSRVDLVSKSRKGKITWARQVAMFLSRTYTLLPLQEIGKFFGRDHATVIHAFQKVKEAMEKNPTKRYEVDFLKQKLENRSPKTINPIVVPVPPPTAPFRPSPEAPYSEPPQQPYMQQYEGTFEDDILL